jgi:hypothetical protein
MIWFNVLEKGNKEMSNHNTDNIKNIVIITITAVWATSFVCDIFMSAYEVSPFVHLIMMAVVGYLFADKLYNYNK